MAEKSCSTVDFSSEITSSSSLSLWFPLGRERIRSQRRSSTVRVSLSQVSTSLSPLPPNKNFINPEISVSGQFQMFLLGVAQVE